MMVLIIIYCSTLPRSKSPFVYTALSLSSIVGFVWVVLCARVDCMKDLGRCLCYSEVQEVADSFRDRDNYLICD